MTFHPDPPRSQSLTIEGKLFHEPGEWGANRPLRRSAIVTLMIREPSVGLSPGPEHMLDYDITDGDGAFSISVGAMMTIPATVTSMEEFLRIEYIPTGEKQDITLEGVAWGFSMASQTVGPFRFNWVPAERTLAEVNGRWFDDPQGLAGNLANLLMDAQPKPYSARTSSIVLLREPSKTDEYTRAQQFFKDLTIDREIHQDFPVRVYHEVEKIPVLRTNMKNISNGILNQLFKISVFRRSQFERGKMLDMLIRAIGKSLGWIIDEAVEDALPDAAAACVLLYTAGRMAKDSAGVRTLNFGTRPVRWANTWGLKTVEISVGR